MAEVTTHRLCALDDLGDCEVRRFEVDEQPVALVRIDDEVHAIGDTCTHANVSLSEGDLDCEDKTIECWKHGSEFSLEDGTPLSLPATKPTPVFDVRVEDGDVLLDLDTEPSDE